MTTTTAPTYCDAEAVLREMTAGRTHPLAIRAVTDANEPVECIVKLASRLTMPPVEYLFEWIGAAIGRALEIDVPAPLAVRLSPELAAAVSDRAVAEDLRRSVGLAYGSTYVDGHTQMPAGFALSPTLREEATKIVAFDVFIHNVDRRRENHNVHVARDHFLVFDHEQAFAFVLGLLGAPDPVEDPCGDILARHALVPALRGGMDGLDDFAARLAALDDAFFATLRANTPPEWTAGPAVGKIDRVLDVLKRRRDAAPRWIPLMNALVTKKS